MKKLKSLITASLLALGLLTAPAVQASEKLPSGNTYDNIGSKIEAFVDQHKDTTAGMETAVFTADETLYEGHFGYMDKAKGIKADEGSVFEWGSTTKTVTWVSVMQQVEAGRIDLKEDIRTYLPEGFLKNLKFDKPITMLDLMNHKGGFQQSGIKLEADKVENLISLKDYLSQVQPPQVFEPGTVTAYSNWGTALAGYIVEEVTGQDFADYVKAEIFEPLGMNRTSIRPDRSDNAYVTEVRVKNKSYDATGKLLGRRDSWINSYPEGAIISTLADFKTYAQALLKQEEGILFDKKETWKQFFSASDVYGQSDIPKNRHGFLTTEYGVSVTSHHGSTAGYSNGLMLDLENRLGLIVMTNQVDEKIYNTQLPELIFGRYEDSPLSKLPKDRYSGTYMMTWTMHEGPLSFMKLLSLVHSRTESFDKDFGDRLNRFYKVSKTPEGREKISLSALDFIAVSKGELWLLYGSALVGGLAYIYALGHLLLSTIVWLGYKLQKKSRTTQSRTWLHLQSGLILLSALTFTLLVAIMLSHSLAIDLVPIIAVGHALIGIIILGLLLWRLIYKPKGYLDWKAKLHYGLTVTASLATLWFIYFFDLYQWWVM